MSVGILLLAYLLFMMLCFIAFSSERKSIFYVSVVFGLITLMFHGGVLVKRGIDAGHLPFANTYETLMFLSFLVVAIYFVSLRRYKTVLLGGFSGLAACFLLALSSLLSSQVEPLLPALKSNWLLFHVVSVCIGYAALLVAAAAAAIFLSLRIIPRLFIKKGHKAEANIKGMLTYLDWLTYRLIAIGFPFLTLGIVTGAVWANESWGRYWNWDPKETWAFITWLVFAICLHMRQNEVYHGTRTALVTLLGCVTLLFTYFGVNFWLSSLHAYG